MPDTDICLFCDHPRSSHSEGKCRGPDCSCEAFLQSLESLAVSATQRPAPELHVDDVNVTHAEDGTLRLEFLGHAGELVTTLRADCVDVREMAQKMLAAAYDR